MPSATPTRTATLSATPTSAPPDRYAYTVTYGYTGGDSNLYKRTDANTPKPTATPHATPTPTTLRVDGTACTLLEPLAAVLQGSRTFRWTTNLTLGQNQLFELVFWPAGQDPMQKGLAPAGSCTAQTSVTVNLDKAAASLSDLLIAGHDYQWGVLLVEVNPSYKRLQYLGGGQRFRFEASGGGGGSNGGGGGAKPTLYTAWITALYRAVPRLSHRPRIR